MEILFAVAPCCWPERRRKGQTAVVLFRQIRLRHARELTTFNKHVFVFPTGNQIRWRDSVVLVLCQQREVRIIAGGLKKKKRGGSAGITTRDIIAGLFHHFDPWKVHNATNFYIYCIQTCTPFQSGPAGCIGSFSCCFREKDSLSPAPERRRQPT